MFERTITIGSMGKTFSVTGWKVGWTIAPAPLTAADARRAPVRHVHERGAVPGGAGGRAARGGANGYYPQLRADYARGRDLLARVLARRRLWKPLPIGGRVFLAHRHRPARLHQRRRLPAASLVPVRRRRHPDVRLYQRPESAPATVGRFCFAKRDETGGRVCAGDLGSPREDPDRPPIRI
jgi:N-succinyldiaminopimelate aminotransferase